MNGITRYIFKSDWIMLCYEPVTNPSIFLSNLFHYYSIHCVQVKYGALGNIGIRTFWVKSCVSVFILCLTAAALLSILGTTVFCSEKIF